MNVRKVGLHVLRIWWSNPCGFESLSGHLFMKKERTDIPRLLGVFLTRRLEMRSRSSGCFGTPAIGPLADTQRKSGGDGYAMMRSTAS